MSHEAVQAVLERTVIDEAFRARLFSEPEQALESYDLTPGEAAALQALYEESGEAESHALESRESKAPLWLIG